jgi:hypothetical protein
MTSERPFPPHCGCDHLMIRTEMKNGHPQETIVGKDTKPEDPETPTDEEMEDMLG